MAISERKFYKTVINIVVLSEEPLYGIPISNIIESAIDGENSMSHEMTEVAEIDGSMAAILLMEQGSDPAFFNLNEDGSDGDAW